MRFVLVANNPKAPIGRIRPDDCLVQFNHCEHIDRFIGSDSLQDDYFAGHGLVAHDGPSIFVFRKNGDGSVSGWTGVEPDRTYAGDLHIVLGHDMRVEYGCERLRWPYRAVTTQPPRYPNGIPSSGFWALYILHRMGLDVALCGFTHGPSWPGHNWQFEREWTDAHGIARL